MHQRVKLGQVPNYTTEKQKTIKKYINKNKIYLILNVKYFYTNIKNYDVFKVMLQG